MNLYIKQNRFTGLRTTWIDIGGRSISPLKLPMTETEAEEFQFLIRNNLKTTIGAGGMFIYRIEITE